MKSIQTLMAIASVLGLSHVSFSDLMERAIRSGRPKYRTKNPRQRHAVKNHKRKHHRQKGRK